jgi:hypothetical protein
MLGCGTPTAIIPAAEKDPPGINVTASQGPEHRTSVTSRPAHPIDAIR